MGGILSKKESKSKSTPNRTGGGTITPLDRAILDLKNSRDRLTKYRTKLESDSNKLASRAKQLHAEQKTTVGVVCWPAAARRRETITRQNPKNKPAPNAKTKTGSGL